MKSNQKRPKLKNPENIFNVKMPQNLWVGFYITLKNNGEAYLKIFGLDFSTFFHISVAESHPSYSNGWKLETQRRPPELNRESS